VSTVLVIGALPSSLGAEEFNSEDWQRKVLFNPTAGQIEREKHGHVFIYEGLTEADIERALESQFNRVESMMFIRTVVANDQGMPELSAETKEVYYEDDGCD
jgi:hypothetical protein